MVARGNNYCYLLILWCLLSRASGKSLSCLDDNGAPVDWFMGYKLPDGLQYHRFDSANVYWKKSDKTLAKGDGSMVENTFQAAFSLTGQPNSLFGMYNDQTQPEPVQLGTSYSYWWGHMKGLIAFDQQGYGFWLIHSVPKMSASNTTYEYPKTGQKYAQNMMCISLRKDDSLSSIIESMIISRPLFQAYYIADEVRQDYPNLLQLFQNERIASKNVTFVKDFKTSANSIEVRYFSKAIKFNNDLYSELVAPNIMTSMQMEGWRHGKGRLESECTEKFHVENIKQVSWSQFGMPDVTFETLSDHAKWAVSVPDAKSKWTCLGDINRMSTQFRRGGGTMCFRDSRIWILFQGLVAELETCPTKPFL
ncbi:hypothetical protein Ciccas_010104 [Cichlidogyrus casuarinus]|uniref:Uncharacterized protein n=1 Tax=Cichlidogyrus casuarinus TaxID=1844966 RepID=A0ABD2PV34_9PLAT